jgi:hypothetical protein
MAATYDKSKGLFPIFRTMKNLLRLIAPILLVAGCQSTATNTPASNADTSKATAPASPKGWKILHDHTS